MRRESIRVPLRDITLHGLLYRPVKAGRRPALVLLHGWGPADMNGAEVLDESARSLAEAGYVTLSLSMRGWPETGGEDDAGAEQPADTVGAVEWLAERPNVDPARIGLVGFSQGGQVSLLAAARGASVRALVAWYPVTDVERWGATSTEREVREWYVPEVCSTGNGPRDRSPVHVAEKIDVPVLLIHGDRDDRVPTEQSRLMERALQDAGRRVEMLLVPGMEHGKASWPPEIWRETWQRMLEFLEQTLSSPE